MQGRNEKAKILFPYVLRYYPGNLQRDYGRVSKHILHIILELDLRCSGTAGGSTFASMKHLHKAKGLNKCLEFSLDTLYS